MLADKNKTMMQYFEWYLPNDGLWWKRCAAKAENLAALGITDVWLPPAYKSTSQDDVGYSVYDMYDLGEFDQKGTVRTKYGTAEEYRAAVGAFHEAGIQVFADIVLNHRMGGDEAENATAYPVSPDNRNEIVGEKQTVRVWSRFTFPGRAGKDSSFTWNHSHFTGTDWDELSKESGKIFRFADKSWDPDTDPEFGNFDYLMGMNVDMENPEVAEETRKWLIWYLEKTGVDGLRLDAVKHISFPFYRELLTRVRQDTGLALPAVGEYWSGDIGRLLYYLDSVDNTMSLFDAALHYNFFHASESGGGFDMRRIFHDTLVTERPANAVTFVDNHDTQYGQSLQSFVADWFKPLSYALILLRKAGVPCVFYADYYGNPVRNLPPVLNLGKLIRLRSSYAYGEQDDYLDDPHIIGWIRRGDRQHRGSGLAAVLSNDRGGALRMYMGRTCAGEKFYDALRVFQEPVRIDEEGYGLFPTAEKNVSVWVRKEALEDLVIHD